MDNDADAHQVQRGDVIKGSETPTGYLVVPQDDKPTFSKDDTLQLVSVPMADLERETFPGAGMYYLSPTAGAGTDGWLVLHELAKDRKVGLVGQAALKTNAGRKIYQVTSFRDYLVLQELAFPEVIRDAPEAVVTDTAKTTLKELTKLARQWVSTAEIPWDKFDASDLYSAELLSWIAEHGEAIEIENPKVPEAPKDANALMTQLLEEMKKATS